MLANLRLGCRRGFTLLEMMMVLAIIAVLAAATLPGFSSAINEHHVREDGHQLAMMVREAMIQSTEQGRPFIIDLSKHGMKLYGQNDDSQQGDDTQSQLFQDSGSTQTNADQPLDNAVSQTNIDQEQTLDSPNKLQVPDPTKTNGWMDMPDAGVEWVFQPGELCPADKIRIVRGDAYLEMDFAALTGAVDTEKYNFP